MDEYMKLVGRQKANARTKPALHKHIVSIAQRKVCRCHEVPPKQYDDRCDTCGKLYQEIRQT